MDTEKTAFLVNPIEFNTDRMEALESAYDHFFEAIEEYSKNHRLSSEQTKTLMDFVKRVYLERKAGLLLEEKTKDFSSYLYKAIRFALTKSFKEDENVTWTKVLYYNNKKSLVKHEY
jgi:hypothetical protein